MATWPDLTDYHEALQSPQRSLADPELQDATLCLASRRGRVLPVAAASFAEQLIAVFEEL